MLARLICLLTFGLLCPSSPRAEIPESIDAGGVQLQIHADRRIHFDRHGGPWTSWLRTSIAAASTVTGEFPRDDVRVVLQPTSRSSGAIAFGQVRRSHPPQIRFYVAPDASLDSLLLDWRGYHEFAHLLIPFPGNRDIWFTEGLASYYQYLLQARAGVISEQEAWRELLSGFERGLSDRRGRGRSLRSLSPEMWSERAYRRVYWTGAAFFLRVDTRLRLESDGRHSLDRALAEFNDCCIAKHRRWSAELLIEELGRLSIPEIWRQEYLGTINRRAEPRFTDALARLGIRHAGSARRANFDSDPDKRALRAAIAGRRFDAIALLRQENQPESLPAP